MTLPGKPKDILCVCLGNICRSPTAEVLMRAVLPDLRIDSAGTGGWHLGKPPYGPMMQAASARGYDLSRLRARQVSVADFRAFDLILAMDAENVADLQALAPEGGAELRLFLEPLGGGDVPDPYFTRDFDTAIDLIERAAAAWGKELG